MKCVAQSHQRPPGWLIRVRWWVMITVFAITMPRSAWSDSFARSIAPPGDDLQVDGSVTSLLPRVTQSNRRDHWSSGWRYDGRSASSDLGADRLRISLGDGLEAAAQQQSLSSTDGPLSSDRLAYRSDWPKTTPQGVRIDSNLIAPRTWVIQDLFQGMKTITTIVEKDRLCLDHYFYWPIWSFAGDVYQDHWYYYSRKTLLCLGLNVGTAAILANTSIDQDIRDRFQANLATGADWGFARRLGDPWIVSTFLLGIWAIDEWAPQYGFFREHLWTPELGYWSRQSLRALLVGTPTVLLLQYGTGASRPGEAAHGSQWRPLADNNGVSTRTFVGAVPFLVAARRTDHFLLKAALVAGSGFTGYMSLDDDANYFSQVLLGWSIAYLSVEATHWTEHSKLQYRIVPLTVDGLVGVGVETRY